MGPESPAPEELEELERLKQLLAKKSEQMATTEQAVRELQQRHDEELQRMRSAISELQHLQSGVQDLLTDFDAQYTVIGSKGTTWYVVTDHSAPRSRLIAIDIGKPGTEHRREVIPESRETLRGVSLLADARLIASSLKDAHTAVRVYDLEGKELSEVSLPSLGTARGFGGKQSHTETFYSFTSFTTPGTIYRYDVAKGTSSVLRPAGTSMNASDYEVTQVFVPSADGTKIPVFLTHRKGIDLDGSHPTYLYGYGGFKISLTPYYSTVHRVWLEMGGVLAIANLRGGGEYGAAWHDAGRLANKQNVFDDFAASAQQTGHRWREQWRAAGRRLHLSEPSAVRSGSPGRRCARHAEVPQVHHRLGLDIGLRVTRRRRDVQGPSRLLAASQPPGRHRVPSHAHHHRRS